MNIRTLAIACFAGLGLLVTAQGSDAATAKLAWTHPLDEHVSGYVISYGMESGQYTQSVKVGYVTSASISGLDDLATYYFIVQSYNPNGTLGAPSAEVVAGAGVPVSIACPSPVLTSPDGKAMAVTLLPLVSGGTAPITTTCSPASGSLFAVGSTTFTCSAVDATLHKASCTSTVVIVAPVVEPPPPPPLPPLTISCPVIAPVTETGGGGKTRVEFAAPTFSGGASPVAVQCTPKSGSQFSVGTTAIACTATDAAKQTASCTTSVTVLPKAPTKDPGPPPKDPKSNGPEPKK
jgi:hypothetical protein